MAATAFPAPQLMFKPLGGNLFRREHFKQLNEGNTVSEGFSGSLSFCFRHVNSIAKGEGFVKRVL